MVAQIPKVTDEYFKFPEPFEKEYDILHYSKRQIIYSEDSTPQGAFLVKGGKVKISKWSSQGKEQVIKIVGNSEFFGYSQLFINTKYRDSATAMEDTILAFIPKQEFWCMLKANSALLEKIIHLLVLGLHSTEDKALNFAYKPVRGRLADAIIYLNNKFHDNQNSLHPYL